jgi:hypothetical protein
MEARREAHKNIVWGGLCIYRKGWLVDEKKSLIITEKWMSGFTARLKLCIEWLKILLKRCTICGFRSSKTPFKTILGPSYKLIIIFYFFLPWRGCKWRLDWKVDMLALKLYTGANKMCVESNLKALLGGIWLRFCRLSQLKVPSMKIFGKGRVESWINWMDFEKFTYRELSGM